MTDAPHPSCKPKPGLSWLDGYNLGFEDKWSKYINNKCINCGKLWGNHSGLMCLDSKYHRMESWYHPAGGEMSIHAVPWNSHNELGEVSL